MAPVHEQTLMRDVMSRIDQIARAEGATRVTRVQVRLGALSHFTPAHFCEHFEDAALGTVAEGATVDAKVVGDATSAGARDVVLESVEVELPDPEPSDNGGPD
jgi:hydrogenase nickel incorporation protein HypA/HybF